MEMGNISCPELWVVLLLNVRVDGRQGQTAGLGLQCRVLWPRSKSSFLNVRRVLYAKKN